MWVDMSGRERRLSDRISDVVGLPPRAGSAASGGPTAATEKPFHYTYVRRKTREGEGSEED